MLLPVGFGVAAVESAGVAIISLVSVLLLLLLIAARLKQEALAGLAPAAAVRPSASLHVVERLLENLEGLVAPDQSHDIVYEHQTSTNPYKRRSLTRKWNRENLQRIDSQYKHTEYRLAKRGCRIVVVEDPERNQPEEH